MTDETTTDATKPVELRQLRRQLAALPVLADRIETETDDRPGLSGGGTSIRIAPGSKPPPGVYRSASGLGAVHAVPETGGEEDSARMLAALAFTGEDGPQDGR